MCVNCSVKVPGKFSNHNGFKNDACLRHPYKWPKKANSLVAKRCFVTDCLLDAEAKGSGPEVKFPLQNTKLWLITAIDTTFVLGINTPVLQYGRPVTHVYGAGRTKKSDISYNKSGCVLTSASYISFLTTAAVHSMNKNLPKSLCVHFESRMKSPGIEAGAPW
jgi:hypothetical protein